MIHLGCNLIKSEETNIPQKEMSAKCNKKREHIPLPFLGLLCMQKDIWVTLYCYDCP